jgi:hypothetical protein
VSESLDVELVTDEGREVKVEAALAPDQIGPGGRALDLSLIAFGHDAIRQASIRNRPPNESLRVVGSNTLFIAGGTGNRLYAQTELVGAAGPMTTWRATLYQGSAAQSRSTWARVAEVTQTQWDGADAVPLAEDRLAEMAGNGAMPSISESPADDAGSVTAQRRKQIFRGALQVIGKKGYGAATIREIAAAAKLPIPTMYQYIKSKEDILYMITSGCMEDLIKSFQETCRRKKHRRSD